jgi:hypothetical protein
MDTQEAQQKFKEADSLFRLGRYDEALKVLHELNQCFPNKKNVLYPMALCLERLGQAADAARICEFLVGQLGDERAAALQARLAAAANAAPGPPPIPNAAMDFDSLMDRNPPRPVVVPQADNSKIWLYVGVAVAAIVLFGLLGALLGGGSSGSVRTAAIAPRGQAPIIGAPVVGIMLGGLFVLYLFICYCFQRICEKTRNQPGCLVWVPVLQMFPLLGAAGMSYLWFFAFFIPFLNILASVLLMVNLCQACEKPAWLGLLIIVPFGGVILPIYLAFSD